MLKRILTISAFLFIGACLAIGLPANADQPFADRLIERIAQIIAQDIQVNDIQDINLGSEWSDTRTRCGGVAGTTSPTYFTAGTTGTSTCMMFVSDMTDTDLNWSIVGSSSAASLLYNVKFTNDDSSATRNWYYAKAYTTNGTQSVNYASQPLTFSVNTATTTTSGNTILVNTEVNNIYAKWMEVEYNVSAANASVYLEIVGRNNQ